VNTTGRSTTRDNITPDDADWPASFSCDGFDLSKHRAAAESKAGFIAPHSLAQSSSQNANLTGE
jgi:hypothetical protein